MNPITVFTTTTCPNCEKVKKYLDSKGLKYNSVNISEDKEALREIVTKTKQRTVPITKIKDKYVVGYDEKRLSKAILEI